MNLHRRAVLWVMVGLISAGAASSDGDEPMRAPQYAPSATFLERGVRPFDETDYSPDEKKLAIQAADGVWIYDAHTFEKIERLQGARPLNDSYTHIIFQTYSPDETLAAGSTVAGHLLIWDVESDRLKHALKEQSGRIEAAAFSPDNKSFAASMFPASVQDHKIRLWNAQTGELQHTLEDDLGWVTALKYSPDSRVLAAADRRTHTILLYDAQTGDLKKKLMGHTDGIDALDYSPDGRTLASGSWDGTIRLWDAETGEPLSILKAPPEDIVETLDYSPDGKTIASGESRRVRLWDAQTGRLKRTLVMPRFVSSVRFLPDGKTLLVVDSFYAMLWDLKTGAEVVSLQGHTGAVVSLAFSKDGAAVLTGSHDKTARLWSAETGEMIRAFEGHTARVNSAAYLNDGQSVLTGSHDKTVRLWDAETGSEIRTLEGHTGPVLSASASPDGRMIASGGHDKTVRLWDAETGALIHTLGGHTDWATSIAFSPDGKTVMSGCLDSAIRLWDAQTGMILKTNLLLPMDIYSVGYLQNGDMFVSDAALIKTLDRKRGHRIQWIESHMAGEDGLHGNALTGEYVPLEISNKEFYENWYLAADISPDGKTAAAGAVDSLLILIDIETRKYKRLFGGHSSSVKSAAYSPDGTRLASGGEDGTALIWRLPTTAQEVE